MLLREVRRGVLVTSDVLVEFRMSDKAWDESYIQTGAGLNRYFAKLPPELSALKRSKRGPLPLRELARSAALFRATDTRYLIAFSQNYAGVLARIAPLAIPLVAPLARLARSRSNGP
jgi:hypothetical protein